MGIRRSAAALTARGSERAVSHRPAPADLAETRSRSGRGLVSRPRRPIPRGAVRQPGLAAAATPAAPSRRLVALTLVPMTLLMVAIALPVALTRRAPHDDEGFFLYSLRLFAQHGGVFSHVLTAYGPAYHELMAAPLTLLGVSIDHNSGRVMTGIMTALITAAAALVCLRLTGRLSAAVLGQVVALIAAMPVTGEPMEPSILVLLFLSLMVLAVSGPSAPRKSSSL